MAGDTDLAPRGRPHRRSWPRARAARADRRARAARQRAGGGGGRRAVDRERAPAKARRRRPRGRRAPRAPPLLPPRRARRRPGPRGAGPHRPAGAGALAARGHAGACRPRRAHVLRPPGGPARGGARWPASSSDGVLVGGDGRHERGARASRSPVGHRPRPRLPADRRAARGGCATWASTSTARSRARARRSATAWTGASRPTTSPARWARRSPRGCSSCGWVARLPRTRAVRLTDAGRAGLAEQLGVAVEAEPRNVRERPRGQSVRPGTYPR